MRKDKRIGYKILLTVLLSASVFLVGSAIFFSQIKTDKSENLNLHIKSKEPAEKIYGLTIDDSWYEDISLEYVVSSLKFFKITPTVRIVMSKDTHPKEYVEMFKKIHNVAHIMAEPVDSYEMNLYKDVESYRQRFLESEKYLGEYIDIWEIGNEINGIEWIKQNNSLIVDKISAVYDIFKDSSRKTAITFYYENPEYKRNMFKWIETNIPTKIRENIDYGFISYYEDENEGYKPDWENVFRKFQSLFPNSKIGIGECGSVLKTSDIEDKLKTLNKYYSMPSYTANYVGGYFWWYYVQDCLLEEDFKKNKVYQELYKHFITKS